MASNAKTHNPIRHTARRRWRCAVVVAAVSTPIVSSSADAEPAVLLANPGGSISIEAPASTGADQSGAAQIPVEAVIGPRAETPVDDAEAPAIESAEARSASDPAPAGTPATSETTEIAETPRSSKPLGAAPGSIVTESETTATTDTTGGGWGLRTALALAAVIGLILLCKAAFMRFAARGGASLASQLGPAGRAPSGLLSVLARYPVAKGSTLVLLRLDRRVLLLSQTSQGFSTLAEIDDPEEVAAIIMRAEDEEGASLTRRFRTLLTQAERDPDLVGQREFEIEPVVPMTPRAATARFTELAMNLREGSDVEPVDRDDRDDHDDHADAVGSLRNRLRTMREVTA